MQKEDVFNATKVMSTLYGGLFMEAAKEVGSERALAFHAKQGVMLGEMLAGMLRAQVAGKELDLRTLSSLISASTTVLGMTPYVEETSTSAKVCTRECPVYDGMKDAGLDHETIGSTCRAMAAAEYAVLAKAFPQVSVRLEFRSAPGGTCVEECSLTK